MKKRTVLQSKVTPRSAMNPGNINITVDPRKAQDLRSRLVNRGLSPNPLPSVYRRKAQASSHAKISKARESPIPNQNFENLQRNQTPETKHRMSSVKRAIARDPSLTSKNQYSIKKRTDFSTPKIRPTTSKDLIQLPNPSEKSLRPITASSVKSQFKKQPANNFSIDESFRAMNLVNKMTGHKNQTALPQQIFEESFRELPIPSAAQTRTYLTDIDAFIKEIQDDSSEGNFIYCAFKEPNNPYHLERVISPKEYNEYFTISKNGVSYFVNGSPREFIKLSDWLVEREAFNQLKSISFFKRFRTWKTCVMWKRNVNRQRRNKKSKMLEEKLFWVDEDYSELLLSHRQQCYEIEQTRFLDLQTKLEGFTVEEFENLQIVKQEEVRSKLEQYSLNLRDNVNTHIRKIMDKLREEIVGEIAKNDRNPVNDVSNLSNKRNICALYEKLGFPENMSFGQRAKVRKECSRFLRFSYLADFYVMQSLYNVYISTVSELLDRVTDLVNAELGKEVKKSSKIENPFLRVEVKLEPVPISQSEVAYEEVTEFVPPPDGNSQPDEFHPNAHLFASGKQPDAESPVKMRQGDVIGSRKVLPNIVNLWINLSPELEDLTNQLYDLISDGLENILVIERWSRHPELEDFATALEEWDDKVAENWESATELHLDPRIWLRGKKIFANLEQKIEHIFKIGYQQARETLAPLHYYVHTYWENSNIDFDVYEDETLREQPEAFSNSFKKFLDQIENFKKIATSFSTRLFNLDSKEVHSELNQSPKNCFQYLKDLLPELLKHRTGLLKEWTNSSIRKLPMKISTVEDFVNQRKAVAVINKEINERQNYLENLILLAGVLNENNLPLPKEDSSLIEEVRTQMGTLNSNLIIAEGNVEKYVTAFRKDVNTMVPDFLSEVNALHYKVLDEKHLKKESVATFTIKELEEIDEKCRKLESEASTISEYQTFLELPINRFEEVEQVREDLDARLELWRSLRDWKKMQQDWINAPFNKIDAKFVRQKAEQFSKTVSRCENSLPESSAAKELKNFVYSFKETMPVVEALRSPLEESHWKKIKEIIGKDFEINNEFTLGDLMKLNVVSKQEELQAVATQAAQEAQLKSQLKEIKSTWEELEIPVQKYKDKLYILGDLEEMLGILDDSCSKLSMIAGNRYVATIREEVTKWKDDLNTMQDILEEWILYQKSWMYLENIFSSGDIKRSLHNECTMFEAVDKNFKSLMKKTAKRNLALKATLGVAGLLNDLRRHNAPLDQIQKQLNKYLETKRQSFPRFYFLSDDELLQILANSNDPNKVQPHLKKCFDNINSLELEPNNSSRHILAMISHEGESVKFFDKNLKAQGYVEDWLKKVQNSMQDSLQKLMAEGKETYEKTDRAQWVKEYPGQIVATVSQVYWCYETEAAIRGMEENPESMDSWYASNNYQLEQLVDLVRGPLTDIQRKIIVALITTDVHGRDIIEMLRDEEVDSVRDFSWQQQLRYYWQSNLVVVRQINAALYYGYEYMGATSRLVITPLTDRCWITITSALNINLGASPAGPAGTGKTESTKDLAKGLGMQCVVFNCSEQITIKIMGRLFSGLAQTGAWSCLDEFNRIDIEVLSVIAQQLLTIQNALREGKEEFHFEDKNITLKSTFGVFITMNPGYAGRTELPDNLKVCFRPVSMMIPDYAMIAEIMLYAEGFSEAKNLSKKMVQLYKLASEQLSQQDHYDFGMRAVKSVLVMAGELKRSNPSVNEDEVLIRAMRDSNIPKFVSHDIPLFEALVKDLFPEINISEAPGGELSREITTTILSKGLQPIKQFEKKVIQLFDTLNVRFGVMVVGPSGSGKSKCLQVLAQTLTNLFEKGSKDPRIQKVEVSTVNPKCITMGELYGEVNLLTQDWKDGLASSIMRGFASDKTKERKWTVFDGPVDSLWIENMNTVLDDNMMLCLANGERIKLRHEMRILFEVQDLAHASPATVSRCGMVYMSPEDLGWRPYVLTWISKMNLEAEVLEELLKLFDSSLPSVLKFKKQLNEQIVTIEVQVAQNICNFLEILMQTENGFGSQEPVEDKVKALPKVFVFSVVWGFGGALTSESRDKFSEFAKQIFAQYTSLPITDTLFDYYLSGKQFQHWAEIVPEFEYSPSDSYFSMVVPTIETTAYEYLLNLLYTSSKPVFFTGQTGVGKSIIIAKFISKLKTNNEIEPVLMNFSAQTSSQRTQNTIESKVERKSKGLYSAVGTKKLFVFVDDVNMPQVEEYGAQPPIELLRQFQSEGGFYDRQKLFWKSIGNSMLVCAAAPPGGGRSELTPRFMRLFNLFSIPEPNEFTLKKIFGSILDGFLSNGFTDAVKKMGDSIIQITIEVYMSISKTLKPTPSTFHYIFNLRDVSKLFQGVLMSSPRALSTPQDIIKLWIHESCRVFHDRLVTDEDRKWFTSLLVEQANKILSVSWTHEDLFVNDKIFFTDILNLNKAHVTYEQVKDSKKLLKELYNKKDEYNTGNTKKMELVFFEAAVEHILRITRTLRQPRGNMLLIGVGGSGKQSLSTLASYILGYSTYQIELTRSYGLEAFREDIKKMMDIAGVQGQDLTFILADTQISSESFLEDINSILNTGEVTNLYVQEDIEAIIDSLRPEVVEKMKLPDSKDLIYNTFVQRVREKLHIVLCMSPVGDLLRQRCRKFPSLVNCATLDWFSKWPEEALISVSTQFLNQLSVEETTKNSLAVMCKEIHTSVEEAAEKFYQELHRRLYITPKSYLDLISFYLSQLEKTKEEAVNGRNRLKNGLNNLINTKTTVNTLQKDLKDMAPELEVQKKKTEEYYSEVQKETQGAELLREQVLKEKEIVDIQMRDCRAKAQEAEEELAQVMPVLERALKALDTINPKDIFEIKNYKKPPDAVKMVLESVCVLLGESTDWSSVLKVIGQMNFLDRLKNYEKEDIPKPTLRKLRHYLNKPDYKPEIIENKSTAAKSLCMWAIAMSQYSEAFEVVKPKKEHVDKLQSKLQSDMEKLKEKEDELFGVEEKVRKLEEECKATEHRMTKLKEDIQVTEQRLQRAEQLLDLLADEGVRWEENLQKLNSDIEFILGNVFLSAASVSYLGPFTGVYRKNLITYWVEKCRELAIPCAEGFSLEKILGSPVVIQDWNLSGLPSDSVSVENGIIATTSQRWPLMIDPQMQAFNWIKNLEKANELKILKMKSSDYNDEKSKKEAKETMRAIEFSVNNGIPVLIEDLGEELDPSIDPIISKQFYKHLDGRTVIKLGEEEISYDESFRLYLTTKLPNPHYLPEVAIKVNIINFTVTFPGLEEQLLAAAVKIENNKVEVQKTQLISQMAADNKMLYEIQDNILQMIADSSGNILDDLKLIETMQQSKETSSVIQERMKEASKIEQHVNTEREKYREVAVRGAILYFVVVDMARVDPMYENSLTYIIKLFKSSITNTPAGPDFNERLLNLVENITVNIYTNVCRGLFEVHKQIFSFMIATAIQRNKALVSGTAWNMLLSGAGLIKTQVPENPDPLMFSKANWELVASLEQVFPEFQGLAEHMTNNLRAWQTYSYSPNLFEEQMPDNWSEKFDDFKKLVLIKGLRTDKLLLALNSYIKVTLGQFYTESPAATMEKLYEDSDNKSPIIFVLSQGADPTESLQSFAKSVGWHDKLTIISLGQGQGPKAQEELYKAKKQGTWLLLQNCHLAKSWMPTLEKLVLELQDDIHVKTNFRLFLTSMPKDYFPVSVLQNSLKLTTEPPKGIKANLKKIYTQIPDNYFERNKSETYKKLLFGLSFFHAVVQERRKFGPLGFNIRYEFNDTDWSTSKKFLKKFLDEEDEVPWEALTYLTGHINYGGRVTDDWDRVCLLSTLKKFYVAEAIEEGYLFSESGTYYLPYGNSVQDFRSYIETLPSNDMPEIFGLHENANIAYMTQESEKVVSTILSIQPRESSSSTGKSSDEVVNEFANGVLDTLPETLDPQVGHPDLYVKVEYGLIPSLSTVLLHEIERFNKLLTKIKTSLEDLKKAIKGEVVMSEELDEMYSSILKLQVPSNWKKVSYPSLKPLASWYEDLLERVKFVHQWLKQGNPSCYWISGFFFPQSFITGTLQTYARRYKVSIDKVKLSFNVLDKEEVEVETPAFDGVYVYGLYLDGARWDRDERLLSDQMPGELYCKMPVIHFLPTDDYETSPSDYHCPVYKTTVRAGVLSTTGQSTNYILAVDLPTEEAPEFWTLRGTALVCQLND